MDTTETYIKMNREAYKFMPQKTPQEGDYWYVENVRDEGEEIMLISGYCTDSGFYGPGVDSDSDLDGWNLLFPIWRQDQLQEMIEIHHPTCSPVDDAARAYMFHNWMTETDGSLFGYGTAPLSNPSMEQLWLAFCISEKFNKIWDGETWKTGN